MIPLPNNVENPATGMGSGISIGIISIPAIVPKPLLPTFSSNVDSGKGLTVFTDLRYCESWAIAGW